MNRWALFATAELLALAGSISAGLVHLEEHVGDYGPEPTTEQGLLAEIIAELKARRTDAPPTPEDR